MDVNGMSTVCPGLTRFAHCFRQLYGSAISWGFFRVPNLVVARPPCGESLAYVLWVYDYASNLKMCIAFCCIYCMLLAVPHRRNQRPKTLFACRTQRLWRIFTGPWGAEMWTFLNHTPSMFHKDTMLRGLDWLLRTLDWKRCMHFTCHSLDPPNPREDTCIFLARKVTPNKHVHSLIIINHAVSRCCASIRYMEWHYAGFAPTNHWPIMTKSCLFRQVNCARSQVMCEAG